MSDKQLKSKAVKIKGKEYVLVSDRVLYFNEQYENGAIEPSYVREGSTYEFKATITPDVDKPTRKFVGHSQAVIGDGMVNKAAAMENAETSAVGRALAMMGIGVIESIASADEMNKAQNQSKPMALATPKQIDWMRTEARRVSGFEEQSDVDGWLTGILTIPPHKVPVFKVKKAIELIQSKKQVGETVVPPPLSDDEMDQIMTGLDNGEVPF